MYYFGLTLWAPNLTAIANVSGSFSLLLTTYNGSQIMPPINENSTLQLSTWLLTSDQNRSQPLVNVTWQSLNPMVTNYTFFKFKQGCGINPLMNMVDYILSPNNGAIPMSSVVVDSDDVNVPVTTTLTQFEDEISVFCINLVGYYKGVPAVAYMAQTVYFPHPRDGIEPQSVQWRNWSPSLWAEVVMTCLLFIGAPIAIVIHRIWLARRREQKRRHALIHGPVYHTTH